MSKVADKIREYLKDCVGDRPATRTHGRIMLETILADRAPQLAALIEAAGYQQDNENCPCMCNFCISLSEAYRALGEVE